jgi:RNA polymerase sigma-70 factor (ECF subfamily)
MGDATLSVSLMDNRTPSDIFWAASAHPRSGDDSALDGALVQAWDDARAKWPGITLGPDSFYERLGRLHMAGADPLQHVTTVATGDLALALACAQGDASALSHFDSRFLSAVGDYVAHIDRSTGFVDELRQQLREKLLVAEPGSEPKIAEYTGKGALGGWLRVTAVRAALNQKRSMKRLVGQPEDQPTTEPPAGADPELDFLKSRYASEFREAFQATLSSLSTDERTVLRMHYLDGLTIEQVGVAYRVSRATAARWLAQARGKILEEMRTRLRARGAEVESVLGVVRSQLDVSIYRLLKTDK